MISFCTGPVAEGGALFLGASRVACAARRCAAGRSDDGIERCGGEGRVGGGGVGGRSSKLLLLEA